MTDFIVSTQEDNSEMFLSIEKSSFSGSISENNNVLIIESSDQIDNTLIINASYLSDFGSIVVEKFDTYNLEVTNINGISHYTLPDQIPMTSIVGNLHVSRIDGLDDYLNSYTFDCGTP